MRERRNMQTVMDCFLLILVGFYFVSISSCNKYVQNMEKESPFRMAKVNVVWNKAQKVLSQAKLADLYADLVIQDKKERELKKAKLDEDFKDGLLEAEVRQQFLYILNKYALMEHFPSYRLEKGDQRNYEFKDHKLKKLWKEAKMQGFSDDEIKTLKEEMGHHQMKLDMFDALKQDYDSLEEGVDNSLDNLDEAESRWRQMADKKKKMKDFNRGLKEEYKVLEKKMREKKDVNDQDFEDPRVYKLWALAKNTNMSETELKSFKKELSHFEHRIKKADYIRDQVNKKKQGADSGHSGSAAHEDLEERLRHYDAKVEKYHEDLRYRIQRRLDEL